VFNPNPRIVVMGGPVPEPLRAELSGNIELVPETALGDEPYAGVLVHARSESLGAVRRFRTAGGQLPIYGLSEGAVPVSERILWIREGADDLLPLASCADVLIRRLRGVPARLQPANEVVPIGVRLDRYLVALTRYVVLRRAVVQRIGEGGQQKLMDMSFHRDQVLRAADAEVPLDAFGQRRGGNREVLAWPVRLMDAHAGEGELINVGPDGVCLTMPTQPSQNELFRVEIEGLTVSAIIDGDARWRRQTAKDRWEVGLYAANVTLGGTVTRRSG
jgi:hypothetical protein